MAVVKNVCCCLMAVRDFLSFIPRTTKANGNNRSVFKGTARNYFETAPFNL